MKNFSDLIEEFGAPALAEELRLSPDAVYKMKQRNKIPDYHWMRVLRAARRNGIIVSAQQLAEMAEKRGRG